MNNKLVDVVGIISICLVACLIVIEKTREQREVANKQVSPPLAKNIAKNIVVNFNEGDDEHVNLRQGDILVIKLRVKEALKKTHCWKDFSGHEALTAFPVAEPVYEFSLGQLPGDDNYQLLMYRVNRKVDSGCVMLGYAPKGDNHHLNSLKIIFIHLRERK